MLARDRNSYPLKVDPLFHAFVKEAVELNPSLNQRKVTKRIAKAKMIIGDIIFDSAFESIVYDVHKEFQLMKNEDRKKQKR